MVSRGAKIPDGLYLQPRAAIHTNTTTEINAAPTVHENITQWRQFFDDLSPFSDNLNAIPSPAVFASSLYAYNAQVVASTDNHAALTPFHNQNHGHEWFHGLDNALCDPWYQDTLDERLEVFALIYCALLKETSIVDHGTGRHDHVTLQDLKLYDFASEQCDTHIQPSGYGYDEPFGHGAIETPTEGLPMNSMIVPQPVQSPSEGYYNQHRRGNGDDGRACNRSYARSNAVIKDWYFTHLSSPYPSSEQIAALATLSSRSEQQVKICLSNLRARAKKGGRMPRTLSQSGPRDSTLHSSGVRTQRRKGQQQHPPRFNHASCEAQSASSHTSSDHGPDVEKPFKCTVCRKSFVDVYGWKRHESSVHGYSDIEWVCMLSGTGSPGTECLFCSAIIHEFHHFDDHDIQSCLNKSICDRTFTRKDLLKQHVQQIHLATTDESISRAFKVPQAWSQEVDVTRIKKEALWCGFCLSACDTIGERMDHVAEHFRNGDDIDNWIPYATM